LQFEAARGHNPRAWLWPATPRNARSSRVLIIIGVDCHNEIWGKARFKCPRPRAPGAATPGARRCAWGRPARAPPAAGLSCPCFWTPFFRALPQESTVGFLSLDHLNKMGVVSSELNITAPVHAGAAVRHLMIWCFDLVCVCARAASRARLQHALKTRLTAMEMI